MQSYGAVYRSKVPLTKMVTLLVRVNKARQFGDVKVSICSEVHRTPLTTSKPGQGVLLNVTALTMDWMQTNLLL